MLCSFLSLFTASAPESLNLPTLSGAVCLCAFGAPGFRSGAGSRLSNRYPYTLGVLSGDAPGFQGPEFSLSRLALRESPRTLRG
jgi:hypothetical protein